MPGLATTSRWTIVAGIQGWSVLTRPRRRNKAHEKFQEPSIRPSLAVSVEASVAAPPFARTCQAAHLLSRVLRHTNEQPEDYEAFYREAIQLHHIVSSFGAALAQVALSLDDTQVLTLYPAVSICFSAQLSLYDAHTCAEVDFPQAVGIPAQLEMQLLALAGVKTACQGVAGLADKIKAAAGAGMIAFVSPLVANCLFQAAKNICWLLREAPRPELWDALQLLVDALQQVGRIWAVGGRSLLSRHTQDDPSLRSSPLQNFRSYTETTRGISCYPQLRWPSATWRFTLFLTRRRRPIVGLPYIYFRDYTRLLFVLICSISPFILRFQSHTVIRYAYTLH